jgi:uncharacterized membrane protein
MNAWVLAVTTFLASSVEFVEAATIVLAVGVTQGWRTALTAAAWAAVVLALLVAVTGPLLANEAALGYLRLVAGPFLILFGFAWLRKAVWRYAGRKALKDERAAYARHVEELRRDNQRRAGFAVAFQGVFIEGLEVVAIVVTFGAGGAASRVWASLGAVVAFAAVAAAALAFHAPLSRVPENTLKAVVGVMLASVGTLWTGEALGLRWWAGDATLALIAMAYALAAVAMVAALRRRPAVA